MNSQPAPSGPGRKRGESGQGEMKKQIRRGGPTASTTGASHPPVEESSTTARQNVGSISKRKVIDLSTMQASEAEIKLNKRVKKAKKADGASPNITTTAESSVSKNISGSRMDSMVGGMGGATMQAMKIDLVMAVIAKTLPPKDLSRLRLTCRLWNRQFLPEFKENHEPISLNDEDNANTNRHLISNMRLRDYVKLLQTSSEIPFTKYHICFPTAAPNRHLMNLFPICGQYIQYLRLETVRYWNGILDMEKTGQILFELTPQLAELHMDIDFFCVDMKSTGIESLHAKEISKLRRLTFSSFFRGRNAPQFDQVAVLLVGLLNNATELESLTLSQSLMEHVATIFEDSKTLFRHLKTLKTNTNPPELQFLVKLAHRKQYPLRLKGLVASVQGGFGSMAQLNSASDLLYAFLTTQSSTLNELEIDTSNFTSKIKLRLPQMSNLHTLNFARECLNCQLYEIQFDQKTLVHTFPNMKQFQFGLSCIRAHPAGVEKDWISTTCHFGVTDLSLKKTSCDSPIHALVPMLTPILPAVSQLHIDIKLDSGNAYTLSCLWTAWPQLEALKIRLMTNAGKPLKPWDVDEFLSGVVNSAQEEVLVNLRSGPPTLEKLNLFLRLYKSQPGISDLKHLKTFVLNVSDNDNTCNITDLAGYLGFAMVSPGMQYMAIETSKSNTRRVQQIKISAKCRQLIKSAFHPYAVINL